MTSKDREMASLAAWLEDRYDEIQAQAIMEEVLKTERRTSENPSRVPDYLEVKLLADLMYGYRKELLRQIKEFKTLRRKESKKELVMLHVRHRLKNMEENIMFGIQDWRDLRDDYFLQYACCMEHYRRQQEGYKLRQKTTKEEARPLKRTKKRA